MLAARFDIRDVPKCARRGHACARADLRRGMSRDFAARRFRRARPVRKQGPPVKRAMASASACSRKGFSTIALKPFLQGLRDESRRTECRDEDRRPLPSARTQGTQDGKAVHAGHAIVGDEADRLVPCWGRRSAPRSTHRSGSHSPAHAAAAGATGARRARLRPVNLRALNRSHCIIADHHRLAFSVRRGTRREQ